METVTGWKIFRVVDGKLYSIVDKAFGKRMTKAAEETLEKLVFEYRPGINKPKYGKFFFYNNVDIAMREFDRLCSDYPECTFVRKFIKAYNPVRCYISRHTILDQDLRGSDDIEIAVKINDIFLDNKDDGYIMPIFLADAIEIF